MILLLTVAGLWFGRKRMRPTDSKGYKEALQACKPLLEGLTAMRVPREAKRFINRTRYLAVRVNAQEYIQVTRPLWRWLPGGKQRYEALLPPVAALTEEELVALSTLSAAQPHLAPGVRLVDWLKAPLAQATQASADSKTSKALEKVAALLGIASKDDEVKPSKLSAFMHALGEFDPRSSEQKKTAAPALVAEEDAG